MPYSLGYHYLYFAGTCCFHLHGSVKFREDCNLTIHCHVKTHTSQRVKIIKQTCNAKLSAFSSLSMMRSAVTITVGSFLTVLRVLLSTRRSCFSNSCDSTSTSSKYALSIILSAGAWFGNLCSSCSRSSRAFSRSVRL